MHCIYYHDHARIQRGGGDRGPDPPNPEICQRWGLAWMFDGRRGGPKVVFIFLLYFFFLARFARQYYTYRIQQCWKTPNHFQVQRFILSPNSFYTRSLVFMKVHSMFISSRITQFYSFQTNFLGRRPPDPPTVSSLTHYTMLKLSCQMCFCWANTRWAISYLKKAVSTIPLQKK